MIMLMFVSVVQYDGLVVNGDIILCMSDAYV
jgi:hypothetical protein